MVPSEVGWLEIEIEFKFPSKYFIIHFQFNGENLFQLTDYSGQNQCINHEHACDAKSPILIQESMDIKDKAILPLRGFSYGPLDVAGQKFSVKIGKLICKANFTYEESLSVKNRISVLEEKIRRPGTVWFDVSR